MPIKKSPYMTSLDDGSGNNKSYGIYIGNEPKAPVTKPGNTGTIGGKPVYDPTPVKPRAELMGGSNVAYPTYTSPTAGKQYSYNSAAPTWQWDDSVRPGDWAFDEERPTYTNQYQDQINSMVDAILNREKFSYDYNQDPLYQQYAEAYTRNGRQAMNDTLAQMAARTGGLASSYAGTASQQAYNRYMDALNDKIPELQQLAYSMYMDEGNTMRNNLGMVQGLENTDYGRYMDALGQWNTDRNFSYGQYQDDWDRYYNDRNFSYGRYSDDWDRWNTNRTWDYNLWQDNLDRQEAAARAAYNAQVAAYNAQNKGSGSTSTSRTSSANSGNGKQAASVSSGIKYGGQTFNSKDAMFNWMANQGWSARRMQDEMRTLLRNGVITQQEYNRFIDARGD